MGATSAPAPSGSSPRQPHTRAAGPPFLGPALLRARWGCPWAMSWCWGACLLHRSRCVCFPVASPPSGLIGVWAGCGLRGWGRSLQLWWLGSGSREQGPEPHSCRAAPPAALAWDPFLSLWSGAFCLPAQPVGRGAPAAGVPDLECPELAGPLGENEAGWLPG